MPDLATARAPRAPTPDLAVMAIAVLLAFAAHRALSVVSPLIVALALGVVLTNCGPRQLAPGPAIAAIGRRFLRVGVVLLGAQLALPDVLALGAPVLMMTGAAAAITFVSTLFIGRACGLSRDRTLLIATGTSVCGAAAVAAMDGVCDSDEEDVITAMAIVTAFGTIAIVVLPLISDALGLSSRQFGVWAGASIHEVAQVVAAAGTAGSAALTAAVAVKLSRVVLLAPLIAGTTLIRRARLRHEQQPGTPPILPLFVVGFLAMMTLRDVGLVPTEVLDQLRTAQTVLFTAALFAMGCGVRLRALIVSSRASIAVGALSWALIAGTSLVGTVLVA